MRLAPDLRPLFARPEGQDCVMPVVWRTDRIGTLNGKGGGNHDRHIRGSEDFDWIMGLGKPTWDQ